jgi:hypothetical protein
MLARRLGPHGLVVVRGIFAAALARNVASAGVPTSLISSTIKAVVSVMAGQAAAGVVTLNVATLTEGVIKTMLLTKLKSATLGLLLAVVIVGSGGIFYRTQAAQSVQPMTPLTVAGENTPVETNQKADRNQEPATPSQSTAERIKLVRQMYAKLPCEVLGFVEPAKGLLVAQTDGRTVMLELQDANDKKLVIHLLRKMSQPPDSLLLATGQLPPRGPEESAVYGLLLRLSANAPEKMTEAQRKLVDAVLAVLDERIAGAIPVAAKTAEK